MIPESHADILESESFGHLSTLMPDGSPQVTPVWVDHDDREAVLVNTARGRQKEQNIERDPRVGISVCDPANPYRYVAVRGEATLTEEGAVDHIDRLTRRYMDREQYPHHGEESGPRVIVRIEAEHVTTSG
ncbi:PPOX class F420-dependent oxidoreductase [Halobium salinum]|uniref:PPOX class F420-dependent oxidoreductase n=1 Tax=Halobium salinum TaxID=1364940 RepID=A0ABD5PI00_9EURY|nr:PPOX class F420-dependent oxidoreductase [Halobium salinum]